MSMRHKVLAYITRERRGRREVLVFDHRDFPEAGAQVPAGTVEPGEPVERALWREVEEESGLKPDQLRLIGKLAEAFEAEWDNLRHVFHLEAVGALPDAWTHVVQGRGEDRGMVFEYRWADLGVTLAGGQHRWLGAVTGALS